jgi:hypothetical protein
MRLPKNRTGRNITARTFKRRHMASEPRPLGSYLWNTAEARRLANRFEWHYTPKHGSWLDMAESELAVLTSQCLSRRIPDKPTLEKEVAAWERHRNNHHAKADWQFTTENARVKLKRLYPQFE